VIKLVANVVPSTIIGENFMFEVPVDMKLTKKTEKVLRKLKKKKSYIWESDDSPKSHETLTQLVSILGGNGRVIRLDMESVQQVSHGKESSGKFLAVVE
jgi:hypothetical protein